MTTLRSAQLAGYRDLSRLRYDYPLILADDATGDDFARSLSDAIDALLREIAPPGPAGERMRQHVLRLESGIRSRVAAGARGSLHALWELCARELCAEPGAAEERLEDSLRRARAALHLDGALVDCDEEGAAALVRHAWTAIERERARAACEELEGLISKLEGILAVDFSKSADARAPQVVAHSVGATHAEGFDFGAWSELLERPEERISTARRERIRSTLAVLRSQRFFARSGAGEGEGGDPSPHGFSFRNGADAAEAFRERRAEMAELVRAMAIAELEAANRYREAEHDALFARFDETSLEPEDLARFPSYLVTLPAKPGSAREMAEVLELLASGLPIKVLFPSDDVLTGTLGGGSDQGPASVPLAAMGIALGAPYVLQAASSSLYRVHDRIREGLARSGPALFSVFVGSAEQVPALPPYLRAASATESRAFPGFSYDPDAGGGWRDRLRLEADPQPERDWPIFRLEYEDEALRRSGEDVAFTFVDFAVSDRRCARWFERVAPEDRDERLVPVSHYLALDEDDARDKSPYVWVVDAEDRLQRARVDLALIRAAKRCRERWRGLQELTGVRDEWLRRRIEEERSAWEQEREERSPISAAPEPCGGETRDVGVEEPVAESAALRDPDEAYIETARCTTCDECTQRNAKMFAYDENKQAYIADVDAGSYRDLVEAAESCQVGIIHPGKPRDPKEPGLAELLERAQPFL